MKTKKRWVLIILACILLSGIVVFLFNYGSQPFKDLDASKIAEATVQLTPPGKTIQITDIKELTKYLKDVVIYNRDDSYSEYVGQGVVFALQMADGSQKKVMAYNPFLVIDDVGYKTEYGACEALSQYANSLLEEEDAVIILEKPPVLIVLCDEAGEEVGYSTLQGTYSWEKKNADGTVSKVSSDSQHPLDCRDLLSPIKTTKTTAALSFTEEPDAILNVRCWSDKNWSNLSAGSEAVAVNGNEIELKPGGYIYEVGAEWDTEKSGYGGNAYYFFYIQVSE